MSEPDTGSRADSASAERTRLSWRRTTLAATVTALLTVRLAFRDGWRPLAVVATAAAMLAWLCQIWLTHRRIQAMAHREPAAIGRTLPATALIAWGTGLLGIIITLVYPPA